jgi:uncharacterized protein YggU (UPF0235/DUF167 family)
LSEASAKLELRRVAAGIMLPVRLTPKSGRDEIAGIEAFGAAVFGVGAQGGKSRMKQVLIEGDADTLARLIDTRLADLAR